MSNAESLKKLLILLEEVKAATRDTAEPGVSEALDEAIGELQRLHDSDESSEAIKLKALECLGRFFQSLPGIARLLELLSGN